MPYEHESLHQLQEWEESNAALIAIQIRWIFALAACHVKNFGVAILPKPKLQGSKLIHAVASYTISDDIRDASRYTIQMALPDSLVDAEWLPVHIHAMKLIIGEICWAHFPCTVCDGLGHWRPKGARSEGGMGIAIFGDKSKPCYQCHGMRIDPEWQRRLEDGEDIFATFKHMVKIGKAQVPKITF